jgi:quercetin dioxygenase-like cupin family protein
VIRPLEAALWTLARDDTVAIVLDEQTPKENRMTIGGKGLLVEAGTGRPTRVPVPNVWFKAVGADTKGAYALCEYNVTYDIPAHLHHREDEAVYVLEGSIRVMLDDAEHNLACGDFLFLPRMAPHAISIASAEPIRLLALSTPSGSSTSWKIWAKPSLQDTTGPPRKWLPYGRSTAGNRSGEATTQLHCISSVVSVNCGITGQLNPGHALFSGMSE